MSNTLKPGEYIIRNGLVLTYTKEQGLEGWQRVALSAKVLANGMDLAEGIEDFPLLDETKDEL